jgi:hypothetical protein
MVGWFRLTLVLGCMLGVGQSRRACAQAAHRWSSKKLPRAGSSPSSRNFPARIQRETLDEARENLREAVGLVLEANRALAEEELGGAKVIRERLRLPA